MSSVPESIEDAFSDEQTALKVSVEERAATLFATSLVKSRIAQDIEVREAVQQLGRFWIAGDVDRLLYDRTMPTRPADAAFAQGRIHGINMILDELTNPATASETEAWLSLHTNKDT